MSKEEFLKIQTCVLKVNIHCDGCKQKVKKILQKIDGVYTTNIDSEQGKVTVSGNVDTVTLIKKLAKNGKRAELWGAPKASNSQHSQLNNEFKKMLNDTGKDGNNKVQAQGQKGGNNQPKSGIQIPNQQQLQQLKGFQDLKLPPQFKDMKLPPLGKDQNTKAMKFSAPEDEDLTDDEFDDDDDDFDEDDFDDDDDDDNDDEFDDEMEDIPINKMKPMMVGNNGTGKKGGGSAQNGGNKIGGGQPNGGGYGTNKNGDNTVGSNPNMNGNMGKNGVGPTDGMIQGMPNRMIAGNMGQLGNVPNPMGQRSGVSMGQMGSVSTAQGVPAVGPMNGGFYQGANPETMIGNPYHQQQQKLAAMVMQQQNQPMMYARPPPAVNYMPPYPYHSYQYGPPPPPGDQCSTYFSDDNTSSCSVM